VLGDDVDHTGSVAGGDLAGPGGAGTTPDLAGYLRRRRAEIPARVRQLHERIRALAERRRRGGTPGEAERARQYADEAQVRAREAHEHAAECHEEAAAVHLRVAEALEQHGRVDRAREHREAAAADRAGAWADREAAEREAAEWEAAKREVPEDHA